MFYFFIFILFLSTFDLTSSFGVPKKNRRTLGLEEEEPCDPRNCTRKGYCKSFVRCNNEGFKESVDCPKNGQKVSLFWNSELIDNIEGYCDLWDQLTDNLQKKYAEDKTCIPPCAYSQPKQCSPDYNFIDGSPYGTKVQAKCNSPLIFNPARKVRTCDYCENVIEDGKPCCPPSN